MAVPRVLGVPAGPEEEVEPYLYQVRNVFEYWYGCMFEIDKYGMDDYHNN